MVKILNKVSIPMLKSVSLLLFLMWFRRTYYDPKKEYNELYVKSRERFENMPTGKIEAYLVGFGILRRFFMMFLYDPEKPVYEAAKDVLKNGKNLT